MARAKITFDGIELAVAPFGFHEAFNDGVRAVPSSQRAQRDRFNPFLSSTAGKKIDHNFNQRTSTDGRVHGSWGPG
jgi:hypothetical protein